MTVLLYCVLILLLLYSVNRHVYKDIIKGNWMNEELLKMEKKKTDKNVYQKMISDLFNKYRYYPFVPSIAVLMAILFGVFLCIAYSHESMRVLNPQIFGINYDTVLFRFHGDTPTKKLAATLFAFFGVFLQYVYSNFISIKLFYDQHRVDMLFIAIVITIELFIPYVFSIYWVFINLMNIIEYTFVYVSAKGRSKLEAEVEKEIGSPAIRQRKH